MIESDGRAGKSNCVVDLSAPSAIAVEQLNSGEF
jgi:hypothetical protein